MKMSSSRGFASRMWRTSNRRSTCPKSQGKRTSRSNRRSPSKSIKPSHGPGTHSSAGLPRIRVPGPGAPAAVQAPAVTESMRVQVAATSRETIGTSCDVVRSTKQKNHGRGSKEGKKLPEASHVPVLLHVPEQRPELFRRRLRRGIVPEQGQPSWPGPGGSGDAGAEAGSIRQSDPRLGRGGYEGRQMKGGQRPVRG